jgi:hypothetical protein
MRLEDYEMAIRDYTHVIKKKLLLDTSSLFTVHFNRGICYMKINDM